MIPCAVVALVLAAALAATGISLLTVAFTRNEEQAGSAIAIVSLTLAVIGGSFFPANQGPELLSQLSRLTPHAWFLDGHQRHLHRRRPRLVDHLRRWCSLAIGGVTGGLGLLRAKRMVLA